MKLVIEEKVKHRLVGIAVILSVGVVFAPAVLKKSQRRLEDTVSIAVKLPPKPIVPQVTVSESKSLFQTVKVAQVEVPAVDKSSLPVSNFAKAEPLSSTNTSAITSSVADTRLANSVNSESAPIQTYGKRESAKNVVAVSDVSQSVKVAKLDSSSSLVSASKKVDDASQFVPIKSAPIKPVLTQQKTPLNKPIARIAAQAQKVVVAKPLASSKNIYSVQLATFAVHNNAINLVNQLKTKGYQAYYNKVPGKNGVLYYKVVVGNAAEWGQAQRLLKQLAAAVQINGFIVNKEA